VDDATIDVAQALCGKGSELPTVRHPTTIEYMVRVPTVAEILAARYG